MDVKKRSRRLYFIEITKMWLSILCGILFVVGGFAGFAYLCDTGNKNVPVLMKWAMSSVVQGVPSAEDIDQWARQLP